MAVLIRGGGEQQFTCFFKSTRVCEETCDGSWRAGGPALAAKGNLRPSKRNKVCMSWNRAEEQMMEKVSFFTFFFLGVLCETTSQTHFGGLFRPEWERFSQINLEKKLDVCLCLQLILPADTELL